MACVTDRPLITILTPCFNEEQNVRELYEAVREVFAGLPGYRYHHLFIDNASSDRTVAILREIARRDPNVRVIVNTRNFGQVRSPFHALLQADGDAVIGIVCDFQDPPGMIADFLEKWREGYKIVLGVKAGSAEPGLLYALRSAYYRTLARMSNVELVINATGFGLLDRQVIEDLRQIDDPYPYFRGLIAELGYPSAKVPYHQPRRERGITKNNFFTLYDLAMLGLTTHSKAPLRLAAMAGFAMSLVSLLTAIAYLVYKLLYWDRFVAGAAPILIGVFFFSSVQLFFIGILGEYIGAIHTHVARRPLVIEAERINFEKGPSTAQGRAPIEPREARIAHVERSSST